MAAPLAGRLKQGRDPFTIIMHDLDLGPVDFATHGVNPFESEWYDVRAWREMAAFMLVSESTAGGGMSVWLQATTDDHDSEPNEDLWKAFDIPCLRQDTTAFTSADRSAHLNGRLIGNQAGGPGFFPNPTKNVYDAAPWSYVRFRAGFSGGTFTFRLVLKGKA